MKTIKEPITIEQWREAYLQLQRERDELANLIARLQEDEEDEEEEGVKMRWCFSCNKHCLTSG